MKNIFTVHVLLYTITIFSACSALNNGKSKQFTFFKDDRQRKLVFQLPTGRSEEKFRIGENHAKEQFYYFGDGSVFYIARNTTWQTVNTHRINALHNNTRQTSAFTGKDGDGLYWKEIALEDFKIGYAYVVPDRLERFNQALNSVKIK